MRKSIEKTSRRPTSRARRALKSRIRATACLDRSLVSFLRSIMRGVKAAACARAEAAASAGGVARPRQRFVVLHGEKGPAGLALRILDDPFDAELIGELAAQIHEAHPHVVAFDERLDEGAVAIALPDAPRPVVRLQPVAAQAVGENADLRAEAIGLDEQRNVRPRPVARAAISSSPSMSLVGSAGRPAAAASARLANLSWARCAAVAGLPNRAKPARRASAGAEEPR